MRHARQGARPARRAIHRQRCTLTCAKELESLRLALCRVQADLARLSPPAGGVDLVAAMNELLETVWRQRGGRSWTLAELADANMVPASLKGRTRRVGQALAELADNERLLDRWHVLRVTPKTSKLSTGHVWALRRAF